MDKLKTVSFSGYHLEKLPNSGSEDAKMRLWSLLNVALILF